MLLVAVGVVAIACAAPTEDAPEAEGSTDNALVCASKSGSKLASVALSVNGHSSGGKCYHYVKQHLRNAGYDIAPVDGQIGAYEFGDWANANPSALAKMGFEKITPPLNKIPKGSVIVWRRGQCGYSAQYGHIEIVVDDNSSRACSDFCGNIKKTCGAPSIFAPKGCGGASSAPSGAPDSDPAANADDGDDDDDDTSTAAADRSGTTGDDCSGKSDGWYCNTSSASAFRCQGNANVDSWSCSGSTVCRPIGSSGRATLSGPNPGCFGSR
jgi:hypothetical protein